MKQFLKYLHAWVADFIQTLISCILVLFYSSPIVAKRTKKLRSKNKADNICVVLGNGPSLKSSLENGNVVQGVYFAVNMFAQSEYFHRLQPSAYFLIDGAFFQPYDDRTKDQVNNLTQIFNEVKWNMDVYVPNHADTRIFEHRITNSKIHFLKMNTIQVDGFKWVRHGIYRYNMGMPCCQTVLIAALMSAINMGYKTIHLYGADHSWTRDLQVDENNVVCYGDRHVYNPSLTVIKMQMNIATLLDCYSAMFKSHYLVRRYADSVGATIYNRTEGSFIDAYTRMKSEGNIGKSDTVRFDKS